MTAWRTVFTYVYIRYAVLKFSADFGLFRYNKYAQITARALRQSLKEEQRLAAEKRGLTTVRYQKWENGVGGQQVRLFCR